MKKVIDLALGYAIAAMLFVRGVLQVMANPVGAGLSASISGIAGIGHILTGVGIVLLLLCLCDAAKQEKS